MNTREVGLYLLEIEMSKEGLKYDQALTMKGGELLTSRESNHLL